MGNTESLPVVSQARSAWQAVAGDFEGARRTQKNFFRGCPVFSQLTSAVQAIQGDTKAAKDTQKYFAKNLLAAADSIPAVGHIKGGIHYVCGDKKGGDSAMIAASRTTGVIAGGIAGGLVGGPVGAFAGGVAGGAAMDGITTAVDSAVKGEFSPHGHIALGKMADNGTMDAGTAFDWVMMPLCDGLAGKAHSKVYQRSRFVVKKNISSTGSKVRVSGLKKLAKYQTLPPPPAKHQKNKEEHVSDNPKVVEPLMKNPLTMKQIMKNPLMKNIDPKMVESILNEMLDTGSVDWDDIAGLEGVKNIIREIILKPMLRPDIFTGLRTPAKGILLFGPPGTGKTMIGRLIASRSKSCFFNISASSLTSKWVGDGEKMVRALFAVARAKQPAVVFIDEIDSILTKRSDNDHEASRRLKTEFFMQFDGCGSKSEDRILIIGVTNRPRELDDAARRRFVKRIYIPLPDSQGRKQLVKNLIKSQKTSIGETEFDKIADMTEGYSGADMATLCQEAAYGPIRDDDVDIENISLEDVRPINLHDFGTALDLVKPSVDPTDLAMYEEFDRKFGCKVVKPKVRAV